jgi:hypothetical protein
MPKGADLEGTTYQRVILVVATICGLLTLVGGFMFVLPDQPVRIRGWAWLGFVLVTFGFGFVLASGITFLFLKALRKV